MAKVAAIALAVLLIHMAARANRVPGALPDGRLNRCSRHGLQKSFLSQAAAVQYIAKVPALLQGKGYITASVDSARFDSLQAIVHLYFGQRYEWASIKTSPDDAALLEAVRWNEKQLQEAPMNFAAFQALQQRMITYLEETGYPFAQILLDSISIDQNKVGAVLHIDRGPLYKIDSIRVFGDARIDNEFCSATSTLKTKAFITRKSWRRYPNALPNCNTCRKSGRQPLPYWAPDRC
jgi:outer membrane protein assembly factor BamA